MMSAEGNSGQEQDISNIFGTVPPVSGQLATYEFNNITTITPPPPLVHVSIGQKAGRGLTRTGYELKIQGGLCARRGRNRGILRYIIIDESM